MPLMKLTPDWKSGYYWLAVLAFLIIYIVGLMVFEPTTILQRLVIWLPCVVVFFWLTKLAGKAQLEADWELPKTPRIPVE